MPPPPPHLQSSTYIRHHLHASAFICFHFTFICPRLPSCIISFLSICLHLPLSVFICLDHPSFPFIALSFLHLVSSSFVSLYMSSYAFMCLHFPSLTFILFPYLPSFAFISLHLPHLTLSAIISFHLPSFTFIRPSFAFISFHLPPSSFISHHLMLSAFICLHFTIRPLFNSSVFICLRLPSPALILSASIYPIK